jgi:hypothetical protein
MKDNLVDAVYFGRVDRTWPQQTREILWRENRFAVMYDNAGSVDPVVLQRARVAETAGRADWYREAGYQSPVAIQVLERMVEACATHALIYADFRGRDGDTVMIGRAFGPIEILEIREDGAGEVSRYKTVRLETPVMKMPDPVLVAMRPQQSTFTAWPSAAARVCAAFYGSALPLDVSSMTPAQVEALCFEFLRTQHPELKLLLPLGRTLPDIDIFGWLPRAGRVAAQVTHRTTSAATIKDKAQRLAAVTGVGTRILFAGEDKIERAKDELAISAPDVELVPIEQVFRAVWSASPDFVESMLAAH